MKVGILTFHRAHNYGAVLQAYALKTVVEKTGAEVEIIDYWPYYHMIKYDYFPYSYLILKNLRGYKKIKYLISSLFFFGRLVFNFYGYTKRYYGFKTFIRKYLKIKNKRINSQKFKNISADYSIVFYGSDQIWRHENNDIYAGYDEVYFGSFLSGIPKKVAYGASMGKVDDNADFKIFLINKLKNFNSISVREKELQLLLKKIGYTSTIVLDPTLLLTRDDWDKIGESGSTQPKNKYIFFYHLNYCDEAVKVVENIRLKYNFEVIEIRSKFQFTNTGERFRNQSASPGDFISLIKNAEFVVTTSYHGMIFSIIYEKQFYILGLRDTASRALSLLSLLGIAGRYLEDNTTPNFMESISYQHVNKILVNEKQNSMDFIKQALSN